jgi:glycosyltransferase involved in cell wall biosynthesis
MKNLGFNVITTLPTPNPEYEIYVAKLCCGVYVFPYPQWSKDFSEIEEVVGTFENIIVDCNVDVVHVNTIMPREALTAARRLDKVSIVHAREIVTTDFALAGAIGQTPASIVSIVLDRADAIVANSIATAKCYGESGRVFVVRNCVDADQLDIPNTVVPSSVCIALVGSNTRKKGIEDFIELAELLEGRVDNARLLIIGSKPEVAKTRWNMRPDNLTYVGYQHQSADAISRANIVVNLSRVPESFGRTLAEALAARRPVIAYEHGAVSELIKHGECGFLVPPGDVLEVAAHIEWLCSSPERIIRFGECGRRYAMAEFAPEVAQHQLATVYERIKSQH